MSYKKCHFMKHHARIESLSFPTILCKKKESFRYLNFSVRSHFSVEPGPRKHIAAAIKLKRKDS